MIAEALLDLAMQYLPREAIRPTSTGPVETRSSLPRRAALHFLPGKFHYISLKWHTETHGAKKHLALWWRLCPNRFSSLFWPPQPF